MSQAGPQVWAIIVAAGSGSRMCLNVPKQYIKLHDDFILSYSLRSFLSCPRIKKIAVVIAEKDKHWPLIQSGLNCEDKVFSVFGGEYRMHSVYQGLLALKEHAHDHDWVLVHDAARPFIKAETINHLIDTLYHHPVGGLLGFPVRDTLKRVNKNDDIVETVNREHIWHAQTPQMFRYDIFLQALEKVIAQEKIITDDAAAIELLGLKPKMVEGLASNIKITYPTDLSEK